MAGLLLGLIYISFVSLGLPDAVLGAAWPVMYREFGVNVSYMGILSVTISAFTIVSSLNVGRLTGKFGTGRVTAFSVGITAVAILGFSFSHSIWQLLLFAVPYGLGAGCVDAALNNYVAIHYKSRHMSWLHCMWGLGACTGPYVMSYALTCGATWQRGYLALGIFQSLLCLVLLCSLGAWRIHGENAGEEEHKGSSVGKAFSVKGVFYILLAFFCYCGVEQTAGQWASSYLVLHKGIAPETAAGFAGLFYFGITLGRLFSGFLTIKFTDRQMIRLGQAMLILGIAVMLLPLASWASLLGLGMIGLGCAPIFPCIIHATPNIFGKENSQAIIGMQMAFAYLGSLILTPLYGVATKWLGNGLLPAYLLILTLAMTLCMEMLNKKKVEF